MSDMIWWFTSHYVCIENTTVYIYTAAIERELGLGLFPVYSKGFIYFSIGILWHGCVNLTLAGSFVHSFAFAMQAKVYYNIACHILWEFPDELFALMWLNKHEGPTQNFIACKRKKKKKVLALNLNRIFCPNTIKTSFFFIFIIHQRLSTLNKNFLLTNNDYF